MILFLDLDGVLHGLNGVPFSKRELLWQVLRTVPALEVVITSSWREQFSLARLADRATAGGGEDLRSRFIGVTPMLKEIRKSNRQAEIMEWLKIHGARPWIALDDDVSLFETGCPNLNRCPASGLDQPTVDAVLRRLRPTLFLDFDGVTHPEGLGTDVAREFECAPYLWAILRAMPAARVVFSTPWRSTHSFGEMVAFVAYGGGEDLAARFIGVTPEITPDAQVGGYRRREAECLTWRENAGHIGDWLAIDNIHRWLAAGSRHVFITDFRTGLVEADVPAIIDRFLARKSKKSSRPTDPEEGDCSRESARGPTRTGEGMAN